MTPEIAEWMELAEADFGAAHREFSLPAGPNIPVVCFHAQQCAEKLIKALLVKHGVERPPKVHDLTMLVLLLTPFPGVPGFDKDDLKALEPGAVVHRYPGLRASFADAQGALNACNRVRNLVLPLLQAK